MAGYSFETITQGQAASFTAADFLFFQSGSARDVSVAPFSGDFGASGIDVSYAGKTVTFPDTLSAASQNNQVLFTDSSHLIVGSNGATADALGTAAATTSSVVYALGGSDTVTLGAGATIADYVYGGTGDDTIGAATANGNYHIYGNAAGAPVALTAGQTDVDTITVGTGSSYIQGNAGDDIIVAGSATSTGNNRIFGGADDDTITVNGGLGSVATINGNKGVDAITVGGSGIASARGGMGDDTLTQTGASRVTFQGDLGDDTLVVGGTVGHVAVLTGGDGADTFDFSASGAGLAADLTATGAPGTAGASGVNTYYQEITDFVQGTDTINTSVTSATTTAANIGHSDTVFASVADAQTFAATQVGTGGVVASALSVGSATNTYVFYNDPGAAANADGIIHLDGIASATITNTSFS